MNSPTEPTKNLVDVTHTPLGDLITSGGTSVLARATTRMVDEVLGADFSIQIQEAGDDGWKGSDDSKP